MMLIIAYHSPMLHPILKRATDLVGGPTKLARLIGIQQPSLYSWRLIPANRVIAIERVTGIPRHELRPDIYPPPAFGHPPSRRYRIKASAKAAPSITAMPGAHSSGANP